MRRADDAGSAWGQLVSELRQHLQAAHGLPWERAQNLARSAWMRDGSPGRRDMPPRELAEGDPADRDVVEATGEPIAPLRQVLEVRLEERPELRRPRGNRVPRVLVATLACGHELRLPAAAEAGKGLARRFERRDRRGKGLLPPRARCPACAGT